MRHSHGQSARLKRTARVLIGILTITSLFSTTAALAAGATAAPKVSKASKARVDSEYFWQAYEGENLIYPEVSYNYISSDLSDKFYPFQKYSLGGSSFTGSLQLERGLFESMALGLRFGYSSGTADLNIFSPAYAYSSSTSSTSSYGFENIELYSKFRYDFSRGGLYGGLKFSFSPDRHRISWNGDENRFSGGNIGSGFIGFEYPIRDFIAGVKFESDFFKSEQVTEQPNGLQQTMTKGLSRRITAFTEFIFTDFQLGGSFGYAMRDTALVETRATGARQDVDSKNGLVFKVYSAIQLANSLHLLPSVEYGTVLSTEANGKNVDQESIVTAALGARISF